MKQTCRVTYDHQLVLRRTKAPSYHEEAVVAQRVAGDGGEVVMMAEDAAAVALPSPLSSHEAEVPAGRHGVGTTRKPPQGDVDRGSQHTRG